MTAAVKPSYRHTEAKYKGGAHEMYVTYDLEQRTRGAKTAVYRKVKCVYIAGEVKDWKAGDFQKKIGRQVHLASASNMSSIAAAIGALASTRSAAGSYTRSSRIGIADCTDLCTDRGTPGAGEKPSFLSRPHRAAGALPRRFAAHPLGSAGQGRGFSRCRHSAMEQHGIPRSPVAGRLDRRCAYSTRYDDWSSPNGGKRRDPVTQPARTSAVAPFRLLLNRTQRSPVSGIRSPRYLSTKSFPRRGCRRRGLQ